MVYDRRSAQARYDASDKGKATIACYKASGRRRESNRASNARRRIKNPLLNTWYGMLQRCYNPKAINYERYGGRGVTVCGRWHTREYFEADILALIGSRPDGKTLDRIDNDGNYEPGNLRWATPTEQGHNRRKAA